MTDKPENARRPTAGDATALPVVTDRVAFEAELDKLRVREKAHIREGDAIAAARRRLPMVEVEAGLALTGPDGPLTLLEAFEGRRQLIAYYFMWWTAHPAAEQCEGCTWVTTQVTELSYLHSRDITHAVFCQGPYHESIRLFARLAVFSGGCGLAAAEAVCADEQVPAGEILDALSRLVDKSLVTVSDTGTDARFGQLQTLWQYGKERLGESGAGDATRARHGAYYRQMAEEAYQGLCGPTGPMWRDRLVAEAGNLRAALDWYITTGDADAALSLASGMAVVPRDTYRHAAREAGRTSPPINTSYLGRPAGVACDRLRRT